MSHTITFDIHGPSPTTPHSDPHRKLGRPYNTTNPFLLGIRRENLAIFPPHSHSPPFCLFRWHGARTRTEENFPTTLFEGLLPKETERVACLLFIVPLLDGYAEIATKLMRSASASATPSHSATTTQFLEHSISIRYELRR